MGKMLGFNNEYTYTWSTYNSFSALMHTFEDGRAWMHNHFVQLYCPDNSVSPVAPSLESIPKVQCTEEWNRCSLLEFQMIDKKLIYNNYKNSVDFFIDSINDNWYLYTMLNRSHLFDTEQEYTFYHKGFVYGYDDHNKTVAVADHFAEYDNRYGCLSIPYDRFTQSFNHSVCDGYYTDPKNSFYHTSMGYVLLLKRNANKHEFHIPLLKAFLNDYYQSENHFMFYEKYKKFLFGLRTYDAVRKYISDVKNARFDWIDNRIFTMIADHKSAMVRRIDYLTDSLNYNREKLLPIREVYAQLQSNCEIILTMILKYKVTKKPEILDKIQNMLGEAKDREQAALKKLIDIL